MGPEANGLATSGVLALSEGVTSQQLQVNVTPDQAQLILVAAPVSPAPTSTRRSVAYRGDRVRSSRQNVEDLVEAAHMKHFHDLIAEPA